ncbi:ribosomal protein S6 [Kwoniella mangroviensis CBS 8507]|uniref:mitochondrial 37S ribosomal protein bS6m n=1 Tax=Kwoniella mangroviensis CBS 8507 TaxID=1296122 RepID=UPI00080D0717|nr:ribosomal protein S6 [Kwoniella mangroviensis CBS 8507]OCF70335.1 ribosomal protein S6 [Kwoniella mangroviensis CBS 8507]
MPLYELFCIAVHNPSSSVNLRSVINSLSNQIHSTGGVVRDMKKLGINLTLPQRMRRMRQYHERGDHFTMTFDTSPIVLKRLDETLRRDPSIIRWTLLKKASKVKDLNKPLNSSIESHGTEPRQVEM